MSRARGAAILCLVWLLAACGGLEPGSPAMSAAPQQATGANVIGTIDRGAAPTCPAGEPCDPPMTAYTLVFSQPGQAGVTVRVGADGSFAVHLDPGDYSITTRPPPFQGVVEPASVQVPASGTVDLRLRIVSTPS